MVIRKVFKAGNSFAVSIPSDWVRDMKLEDQPVEVRLTPDGDILLHPIKPDEPPISNDFAGQVEDFMNEYHDVLEGLSKR